MKFLYILFLLTAIQTFTNAQRWVRQNPWPVLAQMQDIDFDGNYGLAVGTDSTIFTTTNAGITWVPRDAPHGTTFIWAAEVVPGTNGQKMLAGGDNLYSSDDGGITWKIEYDDIDSVFKVQALPGGVLMALGDDYGIYTVDDGLFWQPFNYPGENITAGHFVTADHGWVQYGTFDNNQVWVTTNSGSSWELRDTIKYNLITELIMFDTLRGYMSTLGDVYHTTDGGYHWNSLGAHPSTAITDMHVVNEGLIWTVLDNGFVYFTTSGGGHWTEVNPNILNSDQPLGIWANETGQAWIVGKYVSVLYTPDFGVTWTDQIPNSKATLFEPHFASEATGIVGGADGTLMLTNNGGATWETILFTDNENFFGAYMLDENTIFLGSSSGRVISSHDRGITWDTIGENMGAITDLVAANNSIILVTTEQGRIYGTADGGAIWNIIYQELTTPLFAVDFVTPQSGWAVGHKGKIIHTNNSGLSWTPQFNETTTQFSDVFFTNDQEGWAVASHFTDTIWFTQNGGTTWHKTQLPIKTFWHGVSFMSPDTGWISGGSVGQGLVLRTNDRGLTWTLNHQSPEALRSIYAIPGEESVWTVGFGGNIMRYSNCNILPTIADLSGPFSPCVGDTVTYHISTNNVDIFDWSFPADWVVLGNTNTADIQVIAGTMNGEITIQGSDVCEHVTDTVRMDVFATPPPSAHLNYIKGLLVVDFESGFYQWLLNGVPIPGATEQTYTPTESGNYAVVVSAFGTGCETTTNVVEVIITATSDIRDGGISLYPNPVTDQLYFNITDPSFYSNEYTVTYYLANGMKVMEQQARPGNLDVSKLDPGYYIITIQAGDSIRRAKLLKL